MVMIQKLNKRMWLIVWRQNSQNQNITEGNQLGNSLECNTGDQNGGNEKGRRSFFERLSYGVFQNGLPR